MLRIIINIGNPAVEGRQPDERDFADEVLALLQQQIDDTEVEGVEVTWRLESVLVVDDA